MSDEDQTVPETVTADTPDGTGTQQEQVDWEQRYKDSQAWGTQASQKASQLEDWRQSIETDPDAQREFLRGLGYDVEDDTPVEPPQNLEEVEQRLLAKLMAEVEPVKQSQAEQQQEKELAQVESEASRIFTGLGEDRGLPLDDNDQNVVIGCALTMAAKENGMPPIEEAYKAVEAFAERLWEHKQAAAAQKRRPTHTFSPSGVAGDEKPDLTTHEGRVANAMSKLADTA